MCNLYVACHFKREKGKLVFFQKLISRSVYKKEIGLHIRDETQHTVFAKKGGVYDRHAENRQALSKQDIPTSYMKIAIIIKSSRPIAMIKTILYNHFL